MDQPIRKVFTMSPVKLIRPKRFGDDRGWFVETYNRDKYLNLGVGVRFVQDNHSLSRSPWVLRGLHFQTPPRGQDKLVRCVKGKIWDVAVDVRRGSPSFGQWVAAELSAENGCQLFVPVGFAHGFLTLEPDTEVEYKVSDLYAPDNDGGLIWNDPALNVAWPLGDAQPVLSDKDRRLPSVADFDSPFAYDGDPLTALPDAPLTP
jgi:dTDP-4-dehydrorhamnose 3,5-epimerase